TLDEKIACLGTNPSVPRLGVKGSGHVEGIHGLAQGGPGKWGRPATIPTTTFPQGIGMAETWDTNILRQAGEIEGYEARYIFQSNKYHQGGIVVRAPNADLGRDPRWGRTEECYGEDPYFNGTMAVAFVKGLQGDDRKYWRTAALLKHFLANSNENERERSSSDFDERLLREYYSVPFRMGIEEGGARAFMAAYNAVNNIPMTVNPILKEIARREWGEDGIICTDSGAMNLLVTGHKYFADKEQAAAASVKAGITQFLDDYRDAVRGALKRNLLAESDIDAALKNSFRVMIRLGLLDPPSRVPYSDIGAGPEPWLTEKHKALARLITQESIVLLKNSNHLLPLDKSRLKSIAVIGPRADEVLLDWYSGTPPYVVTPLQGIKSKVGASVKVSYAAGNENNEAVNAARASDVAIVCVGNHPTGGYNSRWAEVSSPSEGREAVDRASITLEQEELIKEVYRANPNTVVVLISSFPYAINWTEENVPVILHMTHNSQEEGNALADVLFGDYNPAGRLVQTWPRSLEQLPPRLDYDIRHGRTYMYFKNGPLYPFGYGLSYTTFAYSNLRTSSTSLSPKAPLKVSVKVKNTGGRAGEEVVQMYVKHLNSSVERPIKELKGFARVALRAGETKTVSMELKADQLAYWDAGKHRFVVENDKVQIMVGSSSADLKLNRTVKVTQ
ncbi:MAG: glycoside hydrolase family 3 C-terminal domain-containing protein, partial [Acidobacteriota bacterium]|nr:glycoside hydrolase family 3 C-terminal domain-containing protein [Acidobacteriota bacterium]